MSWCGHNPPENLNCCREVIFNTSNAAARLIKVLDGKVFDIGRCALNCDHE